MPGTAVVGEIISTLAGQDGLLTVELTNFAWLRFIADGLTLPLLSHLLLTLSLPNMSIHMV